MYTYIIHTSIYVNTYIHIYIYIYIYIYSYICALCAGFAAGGKTCKVARGRASRSRNVIIEILALVSCFIIVSYISKDPYMYPKISTHILQRVQWGAYD